MHRLVLAFGVIVASIIGMDLAMAQPSVRPEPSMLQPLDGRWPLDAGAVDTGERKTSEPGLAATRFCVADPAQLPEEVKQACAELLMDIVAATRARLKSLAEAQASLGLEHATFRVRHAHRVLEDQAHQGVIVFWIAVLTVLVGIIAALAQLLRSFRIKDDAGSAEIAISNNQLTFRTTWLGALLLAMSMGFLVLYLYFVYPVRLLES